jgi:hypothetical protein
LIYFEESNPLQAFKQIVAMRGTVWAGYLIEAVSQSPWMQARALSGAEGAERMIVAYADLVDRLAELWRFPMLKLAARPESYQARTDTLTKWAMAPAT